MTIKQVEDYLRQYGMQMYEMRDEKDGRKRYYKLIYPIFNGEEKIPSQNEIRLENKPTDIYRFAKNLLIDEEYKRKCLFWIENF